MKTLFVLIVALGMLIVAPLRSAPRTGEDDGDFGLFVGSARPLAEKQPVRTRRR
jgi:hypothetical protein